MVSYNNQNGVSRKPLHGDVARAMRSAQSRGERIARSSRSQSRRQQPPHPPVRRSVYSNAPAPQKPPVDNNGRNIVPSGSLTKLSQVVKNSPDYHRSDNKTSPQQPNSTPTSHQGKKNAVISERQPLPQPQQNNNNNNNNNNKNKANDSALHHGHAQPSASVDGKNTTKKKSSSGGKHRAPKNSEYQPRFDLVKDNNSDKKSYNDNNAQKSNNKKKKSQVVPVAKPSKNNTIATSVNDKEVIEEFSSDNINDVVEYAHLGNKDVDKVYDAVVDDRVKQQTRNNSKKVVPLPKIYVVRPKQKKIFRLVTSVWTIALAMGVAALGAYGYSTWHDMKLNRDKDAAYAQGVASTSSKPDINSMMKMSSDQLQSAISSAQGVNLPQQAHLSRYSLAGWTAPGGSQKEAKTEVDFCYQGIGQKMSKGSAFFYTPDATVAQPQWNVDTVSLTQVPCS